MEAAYGENFEMLSVGDSKGIVFVVRLEQFSASVRFQIPIDYPSSSLKFSFDGHMRNSDKASIVQRLQSTLNEDSTVGSMEICTLAAAAVSEMDTQKNDHSSNAVVQLSEISIARFLIYFHHIMR